MSEIEQTNNQIEQINDEPLTKPKKPRTAKQLEAFRKVQEKRNQNIKEKNDQKLIEGAKLMLQKQEKQPPQQPPQPKIKHKYEQVPQVAPEEDTDNEIDSDSEEEVYIVKKPKKRQKPKPKKKITKVIIESDSSESEEEEDDEEENYKEYQRQVTIMRPRMNTNDFFC